MEGMSGMATPHVFCGVAMMKRCKSIKPLRGGLPRPPRLIFNMISAAAWEGRRAMV